MHRRQLTKFKFILFISLATCLSVGVARSANAQTVASDHYGLQIFAAAGSALGLGSARIGFSQWEGGLLNQHLLGVDTLFFSSSSVYTTLGLGLALAPRTGLGVFGGIGWTPRLFWKFHFRVEANASAATTGQTIGQLLAGVSALF